MASAFVTGQSRNALCEGCLGPLGPLARPDAVYCSNACRQRAYREHKKAAKRLAVEVTSAEAEVRAALHLGPEAAVTPEQVLSVPLTRLFDTMKEKG